MAGITKPDILIFSNGPIDNDLTKMREKANVYQAYFNGFGEGPLVLLWRFPFPRAIWIVDPDIVYLQYYELSRKVISYVKRDGGTVILGGLFASFIRLIDLHIYFELLDVPWRAGQCERTTVFLQGSHVGLEPTARARLATSYSSEALFLKNVPPSDSLYASPKGAMSESATLDPIPIKAQSSVVFGRCGHGWLGFTGDLNNEEGTAEAVLAMMGLLD
ncbi:hypothetical protein GQX73_g6260 [Xylaria multiplex]|uniref:Uncharacterized protein n=1 Tax=Xylaria multiplex TaxID=323545 RepID=A0A7C8N3A8_9PEZI|nr:hypothetical protein GQX73_g6260 [Xylaria multiplex]